MNPIYKIPTTDPMVQNAIARFMAIFPRLTVETFDYVAETSSPYDLDQHTVTFRQTVNGAQRVYTAGAGQLGMYPQISYTEMLSPIVVHTAENGTSYTEGYGFSLT